MYTIHCHDCMFCCLAKALTCNRHFFPFQVTWKIDRTRELFKPQPQHKCVIWLSVFLWLRKTSMQIRVLDYVCMCLFSVILLPLPNCPCLNAWLYIMNQVDVFVCLFVCFFFSVYFFYKNRKVH